jgi:predicted Fe-Mo cluster-binding NifX family protein
MKVRFAVQQNKGLEGTVYAHFGPAPAFVIVDTDLNQVSAELRPIGPTKYAGPGPMPL